MIVRRGFNPPPSFHSDELRKEPVGHFFDVMTRGYGTMYSYAVANPRPRPVVHRGIYPGVQLSQHAVAVRPPRRIGTSSREPAMIAAET